MKRYCIVAIVCVDEGVVLIVIVELVCIDMCAREMSHSICID